ncbi:MAG TPA: heme-binding domain-containing protein [Candidatus Acidoferrales bacterium]|nr:heme-binding domain-containing protein [Candidatus Acidoferrales bacterium]
MKKWLKWAGLAVAIMLGALQFVPVTRVNPTERSEAALPPEVQGLLQRACFDCHSNETRWPWYSYIAPVSFLIAHDVRDGRRELNFSLWNQYNDRRKARKFKEIVEQVEKKKMPQWYYVLVHPEAKLSDAEREIIMNWAKQP